MLTEKQKQILKLLIYSERGYNINQIAKITNFSVSWTYETLKLLSKQGHLIPLQVANSVIFKVNFDNIMTQKLIELIVIEEKSQNIQKAKIYATETNQENIPKIIQESKYFKNLYKKISDNPQSNINYSPKSTIPMSTPAAYSFNSVQNTGNAYSVPKAGDVNAVLSNYANVSNVFGYNKNSELSEPKHYGSTGASPVSVESKVSNNVANFSFTQHISHLTGGNAPGCRYCGPEIKVI